MANRFVGAGQVRTTALGWAARPHCFPVRQHAWCFSTSAIRQAKHAITFSKTSSPELDAILDKVHRLIILPSYLPQDQRKKLYKLDYDMRADPITLELDGEVIRFQQIDKLKDLPSSQTILSTALTLMRDRNDWSNLPRLLEGLYGGGHKLAPEGQTLVVRRAGNAGNIYQVIEAARAVKRTNFSLKDPEVATELVTQIQRMAIDSNYAEEETKRALLWSELVLSLLENDEHQTKRPRKKSNDQEWVSLPREPHLLAARLHLAAAVAAKHTGKQDLDGKVAKYAHVLAGLWPAGTKLLNLRPSEAYGVRGAARRVKHAANSRLAILAPIVNGLRMAVEVLRTSNQQELADKLAAILPAVEEEMEACRKSALEAGGKRGTAMYEQLYAKSGGAEATV